MNTHTESTSTDLLLSATLIIEQVVGMIDAGDYAKAKFALAIAHYAADTVRDRLVAG